MYRIARNGHADITVAKSRFIAALARVDTEADARAFSAERRKTHHAARHHATAWILGENAANRRCSDDGEPAGTAGAPMLSVLAGRELTGTAAVVTRYFGGVKLGTGGLARAYGDAVTAALDTLGTVALHRVHRVRLACGHADAGRVDAGLRTAGFTITGTDYTDRAVFTVTVADPDALDAWHARHTSIIDLDYVDTIVTERP